jgi:hypothetical protein
VVAQEQLTHGHDQGTHQPRRADKVECVEESQQPFFVVVENGILLEIVTNRAEQNRTNPYERSDSTHFVILDLDLESFACVVRWPKGLQQKAWCGWWVRHCALRTHLNLSRVLKCVALDPV